MLAYRLASSNRFFTPFARVEWQQFFTYIFTNFKKIPISRWKFSIYLLLIVCLSFSLARLFWLVLPYPTISPAVTLATITHAETKKLDINIDQLKALSVFGKGSAVKQDVTPVIEMPSTETHLNLILMGVIGSNYDKLARAFISADNKQDVYAIGAFLPAGEGVSLVKIMKDCVIISNNGKFEALYLDQDAPHPTQNHAATVAINTATVSPQAMLDWEADHAEPEEPEKPHRPTVTFPDQAITALSRSISNVVDMNTYNESGKMVGFKISPGRDADRFKTLGLQANDVVIAINDWPVNSPEKVLELYQNLGDKNSATLHIKRGAYVVTVDVALQ